MPGLVGFRSQFPLPDAPERLQRMALALEPDQRFRYEPYTEETLGLARITLGILNPQPQPLWNEDRSVFVLLEGELYDTAAERQRLAAAGFALRADSDAELILRLYQQQGEAFPACLNGQFAAAIWDSQTQKLLVVNDRLGLHPIYYHHRPGRLLFGSGVRALLTDPDLPRRIDGTAIAEFLTFDHVLGQRTLLQDVHLLPQASVLVYQRGQVKITRYWTPQSLLTHPLRPEEEYRQELIHFLRLAVQRQDDDRLPYGLMLSGGLDSRVLLALLAEHRGDRQLNTFTWSIPNSDDARCAREIAKVTGTAHHFFELKPDWLLEKAERGVQITDGMGNLVNLHAFAALEQESQYAQVMYKGFMGDAMFGFGIRPRFWADYDDQTRMDVHIEAYRDYRVLSFDFPEHAALFTPAFRRELGDSVMEDYRAGMAGSNSRQLTDQRIYFDLTQRVPRMTVNGVLVVRDRAAVRLPFCDNDLVEFSLHMPPWMLYERSLMTHAFIEAYPRLARVPLASTGLPMIADAREVWQRARHLAQWHLRKHGLQRLAGPDRRPYKDYNLWFRTVLRPWAEGTLLHPQSLDRGYFNPDFITRLVQDHMSGKANHAVRLGALLAVELWHRQYIDSTPAGPGRHLPVSGQERQAA
jgi:asparagine synthase (glutamine-hydrolysing)